MILILHRQRQKDQDFQASLGYNATLSQTKTIREPSKTRAHQTSEWVCASMPAGHMLSLDQLGALNCLTPRSTAGEPTPGEEGPGFPYTGVWVASYSQDAQPGRAKETWRVKGQPNSLCSYENLYH